MSEFIYYALKEAVPRIEANAPGTTFREVSGRAMASVLLPVPPMEEQQRIVEQLDSFMAQCDELEAACRKRAARRSDLTDAGVSWFL